MDYCTVIPKSTIPAVHRIIVIGDIHGDWVALRSALTLAKLVSADGAGTGVGGMWTGGTAHLVQVGDLIDRGGRAGAKFRDEHTESKILRYMFALKTQAQQAGGDVHILLGNHELMNVAGDFRYVSPMGQNDFGGRRREAFRPGGSMARELACNTSAVLKIGSWIFSHAGVTSEVSSNYSPDEVNAHIRRYLLGDHASVDSRIMNMFWHRDYNDQSTCPAFRRAVSHWNARNMAIGHTVTSGITNSCGRSLWSTDVALSDAFGRCSVGQKCIEILEILDDGRRINILKGRKGN